MSCKRTELAKTSAEEEPMSKWWLIAAFICGANAGFLLFAVIQVSGYLPRSMRNESIEG
jgi:RsiW-degrading membrane proteinase PrsW (M82 family)